MARKPPTPAAAVRALQLAQMEVDFWNGRQGDMLTTTQHVRPSERSSTTPHTLEPSTNSARQSQAVLE